MTRLRKYLLHHVHIAPLAVFRILFGGIMFISMLRFLLNGWVHQLYIAPKLYFPFYGFEWVKVLPPAGMYLVFGLLLVSSLLICLGLFYRFSALLFFVLFTYVELIDKTNYLNHYYFVSIISFLMILVPAAGYFSLDVKLGLKRQITHVPRWTIGIFRLQLAMVYVFAGLAKINPDWLFEALPLRMWLPAKADIPLLGPLFDQVWVAYVCCWFGMLYDLSVPFLLMWRPTRWFAYSLVIIFHLLTALLFQIGMFPYIMMLCTLVFFPEKFHINLLNRMGRNENEEEAHAVIKPLPSKTLPALLVLHFMLQVIIPFRFLFYPGSLFWTEQGYRFSWRVMLMEKAGSATFHVKEPATGRKGEVINSMYLSPYQEKMMATQPDMILQFAHTIAEDYSNKGLKDPQVFVESYVTLNGSGSRLFLDSTVNLAKEKESFSNKTWILPYHE